MRDNLLLVILLCITISNSNFIYSSIIYTIKENDTIWSISKKFNIPVDIINIFNKIENNKIKIGQNIIIPEVITHEVRKGDTITSISRKYLIKPEIILIFNNLNRDNINTGKKLYIPLLTSNDYYKSENKFIYTVKKGDTLTSLSKNFNINIEEILKINNKRSKNLIIGEKLILYNINNINRNSEKEDKKFNIDLPVPLNLIKFVKETDRGILITISQDYCVRAFDDGIVEFIDNVKFYRGIVIIKYPGNYRFIYGGFVNIYVENNNKVKKGEIIGKIGNNNNLGDNELYIEIRKEKSKIDILNIYPQLKEKLYISKK